MKITQVHKCSTCDENGVRLYRIYCRTLRDDEIYCERHIPKAVVSMYVPLIEDTDGTVWGYTSVPQDAIERWKSLPEKDREG